MTTAPTVSLIVITRDEEALIGQCLRSAASFCSEMVVVDSLSTDRTVEIAKGLGAQVYQQPVHQLRAAEADRARPCDLPNGCCCSTPMSRQPTSWGAKSKRQFADRIRPPVIGSSAMLYHLSHYYTRPIYRDRPVRLFRRDRGHIGGVDPHDKVIVDGRIARLKSPILHFSYKDIADHVATMNRFSTRAAAEAEPSALAAIQMFTHPLWRFINFYIVRGGFRDGGAGLYASMSAAFYVFIKYAKIYERRLKTRHPR